jgi:hypothetical protein
MDTRMAELIEELLEIVQARPQDPGQRHVPPDRREASLPRTPTPTSWRPPSVEDFILETV